jgi:hypothetical protein
LSGRSGAAIVCFGGTPRTGAPAGRGATGPGPARGGGRGRAEWLERSPKLTGTAAAALDIKIDKPFVPGSAARKVHRLLRGLGCRLVVPAESFRVTGTSGPLVAGEEQRAQRWAETAAQAASAARHKV